jgi:hypothetical protein
MMHVSPLNLTVSTDGVSSGAGLSDYTEAKVTKLLH